MLKGRETKKTFYGVKGDGDTPAFTRMKYFTDLSVSKNPIEYSRRYVDEKMERSDVVGYSPSLSYGFDEYSGNAVLEDIVNISNEELVGSDTHRDIIMVDFSEEVSGGYYAIKRTYAVIPDSEGDSTDAYTYSGTFKAVGDKVIGIATISEPENGNGENVNVITFAETTVEA